MPARPEGAQPGRHRVAEIGVQVHGVGRHDGVDATFDELRAEHLVEALEALLVGEVAQQAQPDPGIVAELLHGDA